jgi:hypothetical protein
MEKYFAAQISVHLRSSAANKSFFRALPAAPPLDRRSTPCPPAASYLDWA